MACSMYSVMFSSMMVRTAFSTSGDVPRRRRRGMRMVEPTGFMASAHQNSASGVSVAVCIHPQNCLSVSVRLAVLCVDVVFFRPNVPAASYALARKKRFIRGVTMISPPSLCMAAYGRSV